MAFEGSISSILKGMMMAPFPTALVSSLITWGEALTFYRVAACADTSISYTKVLTLIHRSYHAVF
jgi:hypothetical protein